MLMHSFEISFNFTDYDKTSPVKRYCDSNAAGLNDTCHFLSCRWWLLIQCDGRLKFLAPVY